MKERIDMRMNELVRLEKNPLLRIVPLEIKRFFSWPEPHLGKEHYGDLLECGSDQDAVRI